MNRRASAPLASLQRLLGDGRAGGKLTLIHLAPGVRPAGNFGPPPLMGVRIGGIELIVKTSPRFTVNWPALASSILEDSGPVFTNRRCGAISPVPALFSIGRRMHSTGFCVPWPVSDFKFLSICHNVVCEWSPTQDAVLPLRTTYQHGSCLQL